MSKIRGVFQIATERPNWVSDGQGFVWCFDWIGLKGVGCRIGWKVDRFEWDDDQKRLVGCGRSQGGGQDALDWVEWVGAKRRFHKPKFYWGKDLRTKRERGWSEYVAGQERTGQRSLTLGQRSPRLTLGYILAENREEGAPSLPVQWFDRARMIKREIIEMNR